MQVVPRAVTNTNATTDMPPCNLVPAKVATAHLDGIATKWDFDAANTEPLVQTCMTTLSSKV